MRKLWIFSYIGVILFTPHLFYIPTIYFVLILEIGLLPIQKTCKRIPLIFVMLITTLGLIASLYNSELSAEFFRQIVIFTVLYLAICRILKSVGTEKFISMLCIWLVMESCVVVFSGMIPEISSGFHQVFTLTDKAYRYIGDNVLVNRYSGFAPSGFSNLSVYLALILLIVLERGSVSYVLKVVIAVVTLWAIVFIGRSGLIVAALYFIMKGFQRKMEFLLACFVIVNITFLYFIVGFEYPLSSTIEFALDPFVNGFDSVSVKALVDSELYFPEYNTLGSGALVRSEGGEDSDVGWVKLIGFWGYWFTIIYFMAFIIMLGYRSDPSSKFLLFFFTLVWVFFNFKDLYFMSSGYIQAYIIIYLISRYNPRIRKRSGYAQ